MNKKKLIAAGLAIAIPGFAVAGSGTIQVTQGTGTVYQTTTTAGGNNLANVVACDQSAGANCQTVNSSHQASTLDGGLNVAQASTTSGQTGPLAQTATTTAAPTYTTAKTNPLSTDVAGNLRVLDSTVNTSLGTVNTSLGTINTTLGTPMQASGGSVTANAGTNLNTSTLALETGGNLASVVTQLGAVTTSPTANTIADRLKTINTTLGTPIQATGGTVGLVAGTAAIGQVGGFDSGPVTSLGTVTPPANSSHAAGVSVGGLFTFSMARTNGGSGIVTQFLFKSVGASVGAYTVRIWDKSPAGTTCTDNSAFVGADADDVYLITAPFAITPVAPANTTGDSATYAAVTNVVWDYKNADSSPGTNLYACIITNATDTADDNHVIRATLSGPQN